MSIPLGVALDPVGNISLSIQVAILFMLILGLPLVKGLGGKKNFVRHGYLTVVAVALHTVLVFAIMIPSFGDGIADFSGLSFLESFTVWSHAVLGSAAEVLGVILVGYWLVKSPSRMFCGRLRKLMLPTFIIWTLSVVNGALVHILGLV
jgi:hypothetical protein